MATTTTQGCDVISLSLQVQTPERERAIDCDHNENWPNLIGVIWIYFYINCSLANEKCTSSYFSIYYMIDCDFFFPQEFGKLLL